MCAHLRPQTLEEEFDIFSSFLHICKTGRLKVPRMSKGGEEHSLAPEAGFISTLWTAVIHGKQNIPWLVLICMDLLEEKQGEPLL